jgi:hypothetical protein
MVRTRVLVASAALSYAGLCIASPEEEIRASFDKFVPAQNAHDLGAVKALLNDDPSFLWVTRGNVVWGVGPSLERFAALYQGTWSLAPELPALRIALVTESVALLEAPVVFSIGLPGQSATHTPFILTQTWVRKGTTWQVAAILPISMPAPLPAK